jgi:hypothetical protein
MDKFIVWAPHRSALGFTVD